MTIDATQTQGLTRELTRDTLSAGPRGKVELKSSDKDKETRGGADQKSFSLFGDDDVSFWDVLDVFNPLQHIPLLNSIYREATGDQIKPAAKLLGGTLFGGLYGLGAAVIDVGIEGLTGKDLGEHAIALANGETGEKGTAHVLADNSEADDPWRAFAENTAAAALAATTQAPAAPVAKPAADVALPDWDALQTPVAATTKALKVAAAPEAKTFPMPQRRNAYADSPKSIGEIRAGSSGKSAATTKSNALPTGLSEQAMRAAGLTPDRIQDVLKAHGTTASADPLTDVVAQSIDIGGRNSTGGAEGLWFYSAMNQALDKYRAADALHGSDGVPTISATTTH